MTEAFATLPGARVLQYHNITPARVLRRPTMPGIFRLAALGRRELATLAGHVDLALGDSEFNRQELEALGFAPTGVLPIAVNTARITDAPPRPALERILSDGLINILFVGRIVPNKKIEDHIRLAEHVQALRRQLLPLHLRRALRRRAALLRADPGADRASTRCCRTASGSPGRCRTRTWRRSTAGPTSTSRSASTRASACRWSRRWPRTCRCWPTRPAAVPETLGGAGVLFAPKDLEVAAELLGALVYDRDRCAQRVLAGQRAPAAGLRAAAHRSAARHVQTRFASRIALVKNRFHRPALRHRDPRRLRVPLPADRRAARAAAPGRGADDLRARLHHLEERVSGGHRPHPRRHRAALRERAARATSTRSTATPTGSSTTPHTARGRDGVAAPAGPVVPGAARVPRAQPPAVRRPDLLHLPLRADRARHARSRRTRASWCRPRTTSRRSTSGSTRSCSARRRRSPTTPTSSGAS